MPQLFDDYFSLKKSYPSFLLFYRLGSFYELYFDDAILAAKELNIVLNHKKIFSKQIPSCGFPVKSLAVFSNKLLQAGFRIIVAEQFIDPNNSKNITRKVNKIITPGTFVDDQFLQNQENILLAIVEKNNHFDLCFGNILLGDFYVDQIPREQINQYLEAIKPVEILLEDKKIIDEKFHSLVTFCNQDFNFKFDNSTFKILSKYHNLALRNIFSYVASIHNSRAFSHFKIHQYQNPKYLKIDSKTINNLELKKIIPIVDKTNCQIGKRFLQLAILKPLADARKINDRLDGVEFLIKENSFLKQLQNHLKNLPDLEKLIGRIVLSKNSTINDLSLILEALQVIVKISEILFWQNNSHKTPLIFSEIRKKLFVDFELINLLDSAIDFLPTSFRRKPESIRKNSIPAFAGMTLRETIKTGFNSKLDYYKKLQQQISQEIQHLQNQYQHKSGIKNLLIEFNSLLGFYFEIKRDKASKIDIPQDWQLLQNLNNSIRFSSQKLKNYQLENADLEIKIKAIEEEILQNLTKEISANFKEIKNSCKAVGMLDLLVSFAVVAATNNYVKPIINSKNKVKIIAGKHFISNQFIANDCILDDKKIAIITGENMAGKSTFLRQNALIVLLAQAGCFVPASSAEISVIKQIFSKMIVSDNLTKNQSSFMVEMLEIAEILKNADQNSLVIIDELCQTTNALEGEKIAFAIVKYLLEHNKSLALITTHQISLVTKLKDFPNILCQKIADNHKIDKGVALELSAIKIIKTIEFPIAFVI